MSMKTFGSPVVAERSFGYVAAPLQIGQPPIPSSLSTPVTQELTQVGNTLVGTLPALPGGSNRPIVGLMVWFGDIIPSPAPPLRISYTFRPQGEAVDITQGNILVGGNWAFVMPFNEQSGRRVVSNADYTDAITPSVTIGGVTSSWSRGMIYAPAPGDGLFELIIGARTGNITPRELCAALGAWSMDNCGAVQTQQNPGIGSSAVKPQCNPTLPKPGGVTNVVTPLNFS